VYNDAQGNRCDEEEPMSEKQILSMLAQGTITADEAARLLEAVSTASPADMAGAAGAQEGPSQQAAAVEPSEVIPGTLAPDAKRWKRLQLIPLAVSLVVLIATAWGLWAVYRAADARITFGWVVLLLLFLLALGATTLSIWITPMAPRPRAPARGQDDRHQPAHSADLGQLGRGHRPPLRR